MFINILHGRSMTTYSLIQCSSILSMGIPWQHTHEFNVHQYSAWPFHDNILTDSMFINIQHGRSMTTYSLIKCSSIFSMDVPWQHTHEFNVHQYSAWPFHDSILTNTWYAFWRLVVNGAKMADQVLNERDWNAENKSCYKFPEYSLVCYICIINWCFRKVHKFPSAGTH